MAVMIKLGCMSLSYSRAMGEGRMNLLSFIDTAHQLGLDGIDIHVGAFASTEDDYLRDIRLRCLKRGLAISYIGISNNFGKPASELGAEVDMVKRWIDVAERLRVPLVRIFAAWERPEESKEVTWARMIDCINQVVAHAASKGIVVGLHNHNHGCVTRTGADVVRILEEVNHPYFSHILDTGQYVGSPGSSGAEGREDPRYDFYGSIEKSAPYAVHVRAKIYRIQTGEEVWLDYPRILGILRKAGFNGWMSIVYEGQAAEAEETAVPKAVAYLRRLLAEH
jgi:sugar phosphate isomerase/epimerase